MSVIGACKLCRTSRVQLCDSHFLSKAAYKLLRSSQKGESPNSDEFQYSDLHGSSSTKPRFLPKLRRDPKYERRGMGSKELLSSRRGFRLKDMLPAFEEYSEKVPIP
jgi:hypothetical protein